MLKNTVEADRPQMIIRRKCIVRWISKATNTHSQYVMLSAFPLSNVYTNALQCNVYT